MPDFKRILFAGPVDAQAARVVGKGETWTPATATQDIVHDAPPAMRKVPGNMPNLTGTKYGRLTVIGLAVHRAHGGSPRWVCRCVCGNYTLRRSKSVKECTGHSCGPCDYQHAVMDQTLRGMKNDTGPDAHRDRRERRRQIEGGV